MCEFGLRFTNPNLCALGSSLKSSTEWKWRAPALPAGASLLSVEMAAAVLQVPREGDVESRTRSPCQAWLPASSFVQHLLSAELPGSGGPGALQAVRFLKKLRLADLCSQLSSSRASKTADLFCLEAPPEQGKQAQLHTGPYSSRNC